MKWPETEIFLDQPVAEVIAEVFPDIPIGRINKIVIEPLQLTVTWLPESSPATATDRKTTENVASVRVRLPRTSS